MHRGTGNGAKPTSSENEAEKGEEKGQGETEKEVSYCKLYCTCVTCHQTSDYCA